MSIKVSTRYLAIFSIIGQVLFLYGFLGWGYGVAMSIFYPQWLPEQVSHLTPWLRLDNFTIGSFFTSMVGFFIWRLTKEFRSQ